MSKKSNSIEKSPSARIRVNTLGRFVVEVEGSPLRFEPRGQRKPMELLKVLIALGGVNVPEERLNEALWPEADGDAAHVSFHSTLHRLRRLIGSGALTLRSQALTLETAHCRVDALDFTKQAQRAANALATGDKESIADSLESAFSTYGGPFLDGVFDLPEVLSARDRLHSQFLRLVSQFAQYFWENGDPVKAIATYQRGLEADPLAEEFHQGLIRVFLAQKRTAEGLAAYRRCRAVLEGGMNVLPSPETEQLHQDLLAYGTPQQVVQAKEGAEKEEFTELPDKPSIAVLAFENQSNDPGQEFFSDGISEDIITTLSKIPDLCVIARNSSFTYKGKPVNVHTVGRELGVRYVLEGSVRRAGDRVRITAQLIDATTNIHIWADRYDRNVADIFALQDEITLKIVKSLQVKLTDGEMEYLLEKSTNNIQAWEALTKSHTLYYRHTKDDNALAMRLAEKAIDLDPEYVAAISQIGWLHFMDWRFDWSNDSDRSFLLAEEMANRCLAKDESFAMAHALLGRIYALQNKFDIGIAAGERACALDPNNPNALGTLVMTMLAVGRPEEALRLTERAMRVHPNYPTIYLFHLEQVYYLTGRYEEAIAASKKALERQPDFVFSRFHGIACLIAGGHRKEAQARAAEILSKDSEFSAEEWGERFYGHYKNPEIKKRFITEMCKAGLPE